MGGLELLWSGLVSALAPINLAMVTLGLFIGALAGALPGITMLNAIVLVLPFTYGMDMVPSLLLLIGIYCGGVYAGSITGILFNIPGDPMNVPTTWEGFKLNKKGYAAKALGTAVMCSAIGGFLSALVMVLVAPPFARVALSFSSAEYFAVVVLGLVSVVTIGTTSIGSALICLFIGMFLGTIGVDIVYCVPRFTFGWQLMESGIEFTIVLIGLFAIGEVLDQLCVKREVQVEAFRGQAKTELPGFRHFWGLKGSILRGLGAGMVVGAIPGAGATVASFVSYGIERQVSKTPHLFGTGHWPGLAASETSVNGSTGGAMIPLLTLGIPGSGATAVMLGAFLLHGVQPGPLLFEKSPHEVYTIFVGTLLCNLIMILVGVIVARFFAYLMMVPDKILGAFIILFSLIGAFALRNEMADVWFMAIFGVIGFFMRRYDLPVPPLVLGLILGPLGEKYFQTAMAASGNDVTVFFTRPISAGLLLASLGFAVIPLIKKLRKAPVAV
jgi:putative tricarboxylic transport membrane protein